MDSLNNCSEKPCSLRHRHHHHHHHHFLYVSPHCPFHRSILHPINHLPSCSFSTSHPFPQNPHPVASIPTDAHSILQDSQFNEVYDDTMMVQDDSQKLETEEEEEPIFVLTDEWRDFFAKSEAKRRLAKKQAKKKGKS